MKFEEFTLETNNSFHRYLVNGECALVRKNNGLIEVVIKLDIPIVFTGDACLIEVNGLDFECTDIIVNGRFVRGAIKRIDSQLYTKQINNL